MFIFETVEPQKHTVIIDYKHSNRISFCFSSIMKIGHLTGPCACISDNVHFQNSAQFIKALVESNVYFRTQVCSCKTKNCKSKGFLCQMFQNPKSKFSSA